MSAASALPLVKPEGGGLVVGDGGGLWSARKHPSTTFFTVFCRLQNHRNSRHRNDCPPTLSVGQADRCCCLGFRHRAGLDVGRERSSMGAAPAAQGIFCGIMKFSVASLEEAKPGSVRMPPHPPNRRGIAHSRDRPSAALSWRYSVSAPAPRLRLPRFGPSPGRRSTPRPAPGHPPRPAGGGIAGRS